jgi:hypothetical protein
LVRRALAVPLALAMLLSVAATARADDPPTPACQPASLDSKDLPCDNPFEYSFTTGTTLIYDPISDFCSWFRCVDAFFGDLGFVVQCRDELFSRQGGTDGACKDHGGVARALFQP